jgi:hypothetical protein
VHCDIKSLLIVNITYTGNCLAMEILTVSKRRLMVV